ncbi:MAG: hypothetical protein N2376_03655 [Clostridia bacterium]|nr:hypothetical protein [Clostridia bacterium]
MKSTFMKALFLGLGLTFLSTSAAFASTEETKPVEPVDTAVILVAPATEPVKAPDADSAAAQTGTVSSGEIKYKGEEGVPTDADFNEGVMHITAVEEPNANPDAIVTNTDDLKRTLDEKSETAPVDPVVNDDKIRTLTTTSENDGTPEGAQTMTATSAQASKHDTKSTSFPMEMLYALGTIAILGVASFTMRARIVGVKK